MTIWAKPFSMNELIARVEALGRRAATPTATDALRVGDLHMDVQHRHMSPGPDARFLFHRVSSMSFRS